jgi:hypothetical protein
MWSDTSESKYVRCNHCEKVFVISTWGVGRAVPAVPQKRRTRRGRGLYLWPAVLVLAASVLIVTVESVLHYLRRPEPPPESKVTLENYQRLHAGMKEIEVCRLLGYPTRKDNSLAPKVANEKHNFSVDEKSFLKRYFWEDGDDVIWVSFLNNRAEQFGGTLGGEQLGEAIKGDLIKEHFKGEDDSTLPPPP